MKEMFKKKRGATEREMKKKIAAAEETNKQVKR